MINKSENTASNALVSLNIASPSNTQSAIGGLIDISNALDAPIVKLPSEMICHIGSFLELKDKIRFSQALTDAGLLSYFDVDRNKILREFNKQSLTQKINILLENNEQSYDFSKFYTLEKQSEEELTDIYSFFFKEMCDSFKDEKILSEKIVSLVNGLNVPHLDVERIKSYVDREDLHAKKDAGKLIDYLFPDLTDAVVREEIERRVQLFDARVFIRDFSFRAELVTEDLLAFLKMEKELRGVPVELATRIQKLASSHLLPIIQKAFEKIQTMPTEEIRALLIMALDKSQRGDFCEKLIEFGARENLFYSKASPYFCVLKSDLLYRVNITKPERRLLLYLNYPVYMHYVCYYADDAYLRRHADNLMSRFLEIQIENGEDPVIDSQYGDLSLDSPYDTHMRDFYIRTEQEHEFAITLEGEIQARRALIKDGALDPEGFAINSSEYLMNSVAKDQISAAHMMELLRENPHYVNVQNSEGDTLLHLLVKLGLTMVGEYLDMVMRAVGLHVDLNIKNKEGFTPLMLAVQFEDMAALNFLLRQPNLDVNKLDNSGNTALHHAITSNKKMATHRLLRHEATDKTVANADGKTPYDLIASLQLLSLLN